MQRNLRRMTWVLAGCGAVLATGVALSGTPVTLGDAVRIDTTNVIATVVADVTGDGLADIVSVPTTGGDHLVLRKGNGDGTFQGAVNVPTRPGAAPSRIRAAKLNGDAAYDLIVNSSDATVDVLLSDGAGGFTVATSHDASLTPPWTEFPSPVDWDGDSDLDILSSGTNGGVRLRRNLGDGTFAAPEAVLGAPTYGYDCVFADLDGDGDADLVTHEGVRTDVFWHEADGTLSPGPQLLPPEGATAFSAWGLAAADVDGDGLLDVIGIVNGPPTQAAIAVFRHTSPTTFDDGVRLSVPYMAGWRDLATADLNGDGRPDVVAPGIVLMNTGDGTFGPPLPMDTSGSGTTVYGAAVGNFDGDPRPDIALATPRGTYVISVRTSVAVPTVATVAPSTLWQGASRDVVVTGSGIGTGATLGFGDGVTVNSVVVESSTTLRANVTVSFGAAVGSRSVTLLNPDGGSTTAPCSIASNGTAQVADVSPSVGHAGEVLDVAIQGASFVPGAEASFGAGVLVNSVTFVDAEHVVARVTLEVSAAAGVRDVTFRNGSGLDTAVPGAFRVLPPRSLDVTAERGALRPSARRNRGAFRANGSLLFNAFSPDGRFLPAAESAEIRFGDPASPNVVAVAPDAGWKVRGARADWTSPRGGPRVRLRLDFQRHTFRLAASRLDVTTPTAGAVLVELTLGDETGTSTRQWKQGRRGVLTLK